MGFTHEDIDGRFAALNAEMADLRVDLRATRSWRSRMRYALLWAVVFALMASGVATGITGGPLREGVRNPGVGYATAETQLVSNNGAGYTTRLSNFNVGDGGAQASGCRSSAANEPCLQLANLGGGRAFDIFSNSAEVGRITANGASPATAKPFTTNAGGVATGLNADKVDGKHANELGGSLGSGVLLEACDSDDTCPIIMNRNVTSVRRALSTPTLVRYCIEVAGANPATHKIIAGLNGYYSPSQVGVAPLNIGGAVGCSSPEFEVGVINEGGAPDTRFWFAVIP